MNIICCSGLRVTRLCLFTFLVVMSPIVAAQQPRTGSVSGRVIADAGVPMERVTIRISAQVRDAMGQPLARVASPDREGRFVFTGLPPRAYVISASAPGYISRRDVNASNNYHRPGDDAPGLAPIADIDAVHFAPGSDANFGRIRAPG